MKTLEMEIALIQYFNPRQNIIVPNVSWGMADLHECDILILSNHSYATEIEIKISKSDLMADKKKKHTHQHNHIKRLYFAVPQFLIDVALKEIPKRAGLYGLKKDRRPILMRECEPNKDCVQWKDWERHQLSRLGSMRILGLKQKIADLEDSHQINFNQITE